MKHRPKGPWKDNPQATNPRRVEILREREEKRLQAGPVIKGTKGWSPPPRFQIFGGRTKPRKE